MLLLPSLSSLRLCTTFLVLTLILCNNLYCHGWCSGTERPVIFNFGDSNSDTGGYSAAHGSEVAYPYGRSFFHYPTGRFSDGRIIIDFLCEHLNISYLSPYMRSLEPNFRNGVNFAVASAATYPLKSLFNLDVQILQFKLFKSRSSYLHSRGSSYLLGEEDFNHALYTIDIGQNDLSYAFKHNSYPEAIVKIPSYISEIRKAVWDLYLLGARKFWVQNTGPLGCLPKELAIRKYKSHIDDFDEYGCLKGLNDGAKLFNSQLDALCQELRTQMENSSIIYVDVYSIKYNLIANATSYGFMNPLRTCCGEGEEPYNYSNDHYCFKNGSSVCEEKLPYISWDGIHYTEAANAIVASKILSNQFSSPSFDFNLFCKDILISSI